MILLGLVCFGTGAVAIALFLGISDLGARPVQALVWGPVLAPASICVVALVLIVALLRSGRGDED